MFFASVRNIMMDPKSFAVQCRREKPRKFERNHLFRLRETEVDRSQVGHGLIKQITTTMRVQK